MGQLPTSNVEDHITKGDEPFRTLINKQLELQPENLNVDKKFSPLGGRKVMVFSDSRQVAARLAARLQELGIRDIVRAMVAYGFKYFDELDSIKSEISLDDLGLQLQFQLLGLM